MMDYYKFVYAFTCGYFCGVASGLVGGFGVYGLMPPTAPTPHMAPTAPTGEAFPPYGR